MIKLEKLQGVINKKRIFVDFLDGAIWTPWTKQEDIYYFGDEYYSIHSQSSAIFHEIRTAVETNSSMSEISKIYDKLQERYSIDSKVIEALKGIEENNFYKYCKPWKIVADILYSIYAEGCSIHIINNSIYTNDLVRDCLLKCGYDMQTEILSIQDLKDKEFNKDEDFYIGSNLELAKIVQDFLIIEKPLDVLQHNNSEELIKIAAGNFTSYDKAVNSPGVRTARNIVAHKYYQDMISEWEKKSRCNANPFFAGYYMLGMHIMGICKWIIKEAKRANSNRVLFCARDGFLIYEAYRKIRECNPSLPDCSYIQASRRALLPIIIKSKTDFYAPPGILFYQSSPKSVLRFFWCFTKCSDLYDFEYNSFERQLKEIKEDVENNGFEFEKTFSNKEEYDYFIKYFLKKYYSKEKHQKLKSALSLYYRDLSENDIIFDAGYSGKLVKAINDICPQIKNVLYLYTDEECAELIEKTTGLNIYTFYNVTPCEDNMFREYVIAENGPTCVGIKIDNNETVPIFDQKEYVASKAIEEMHEGALSFITDYMEYGYDLFSTMHFKGQEMSLPFEGFLRDINDMDLKMFEETYQDDYYTGRPMQQNWAMQYKCMIATLPEVPRNAIPKEMVLNLLTRKIIKLAYWGTGTIYKRLREQNPSIVPDILIDNNKSDCLVDGIPVKRLDDICVEDYYFVVANNYYNEIEIQLREKGLREMIDYVWYKYLF